MNIKDNRKIILGIGIIVLFALLIITITMHLSSQEIEREKGHLTESLINEMSKDQIINYMEARQQDHSESNNTYLIPLLAFMGLLIGTIVFYIMSDKVIKQEQSLKKNTKIILDFLTGQEKTVIEKLMDNNGEVQQYELSHLPNLNKLRTHRILISLEQKGIIKKEKIGKINKIVLNKELFDVLKEEK